MVPKWDQKIRNTDQTRLIHPLDLTGFTKREVATLIAFQRGPDRHRQRGIRRLFLSMLLYVTSARQPFQTSPVPVVSELARQNADPTIYRDKGNPQSFE